MIFITVPHKDATLTQAILSAKMLLQQLAPVEICFAYLCPDRSQIQVDMAIDKFGVITETALLLREPPTLKSDQAKESSAWGVDTLSK